MDLASLGANAPASGAEGSTALSGLAEDFDSFLNLLTVQLQNQDPTEPLDSNALTEQIVQFTQAEQLVNLNTKLDSVVEGINASTAASAGTYIGREVEYSKEEFSYKGKEVAFDYVLPQNANKVSVTITTESGAIVRTIPAETSAGKHRLEWDGENQNGEDAENGIYKVRVVAEDENGDLISTSVINTGVISKANYANGELQVGIDDIELGIDDIVSINGDAVLSALDQNLAALGLLSDNTLNGFSSLNGAVNQNSVLASTLSLINKNVEYGTDEVDFASGSSAFQYRLPKSYDDVKLSVTDSAGNVIYNESVSSTNGVHSFDLAGINTASGNLASGKYSISVTAEDGDAQTVVNPFISGTINEIDMVGNQPSIYVNGRQISLAQITRVAN